MKLSSCCIHLSGKISFIFFAVALSTFSVACVIVETSTNLETTTPPTSSETSISSSPTMEPIISTMDSTKIEPTATATARPLQNISTNTPTVSFIPATIEAAVVTAEPTTLADAILTATPSLSDGVTETIRYMSPTGTWEVSMIQTYAADRTVYQRLVVTGEQGEVTAAERWTYSGLGSDAPKIFQWSADESVLWYGFFGAPDGCSTGGFWSEITRLDLLTGEETLIGEDIFAIPGPDEQTFIELDGTNLTIRNQADGNENQIALPVLETQIVGRPIWNLMSDRIAFLVTESSGECQFSNSILYIILPTVKIHQTQFSSDPLLFIEQWVTNDVLSLVDLEGGKWFLNTNDGELSEQER